MPPLDDEAICDPILVNEWHPVLASADLPDGKPVGAQVLGQGVVLWRCQGRATAWKDLCIHRGAKLSMGRVQNDALSCPYHGWTYNGEGNCTRIPAHPGTTPPARAKVTVYKAMERFGLVWICLGEPPKDLPDYPEWTDPAYRHDLCGPYRFHAAGPRIMENFFDVGHFPFVHDGLLGDSGHAEIGEHKAVTTDDGIVVDNIRVWQPSNESSTSGGDVIYSYRIFRPFTAEFVKVANGQRIVQRLIATPVSRTLTLGWMLRTMNFALDAPAEGFLEFENLLASQDIPIIESQRPENLPLDLQAELHLRSDRTAIAYRQWLRKLGLSYGTA